ncbi:zinc finger BED domain-containing protein RICESLEEPER 2-like [Carya illinoinensis]|uniref:zinc finger BED domain-containing protein RICESLEEPER 2-like n=1 Tax=Carya illinoinensis TaxID=32201 RepID=UPI001C72882D|nr:zinc finger BED domain-containing protein RICESLEEPER 2-like [Carya illinoinensis]
MLDRVEKFQKAFQRLEDEDSGYDKSVKEDDSKDDDGVSEFSKGGASKLESPTKDDWDKSGLFVKFQKLFYDITLRFSGANYVITCNYFVFELATIQAHFVLKEYMKIIGRKVLMLVDRVKDALTYLYDSYCENDGNDLKAQDQTMSQLSQGGVSTISSTAGVNSIRYCALSRVAQDVLAVPISIIASESAFNTASRVFDPFRSNLSPLMVEARICTQNWLHSSSVPIYICTLMDDVEEFEKFDTELMEDLGSSSRPISSIGDDQI